MQGQNDVSQIIEGGDDHLGHRLEGLVGIPHQVGRVIWGKRVDRVQITGNQEAIGASGAIQHLRYLAVLSGKLVGFRDLRRLQPGGDTCRRLFLCGFDPECVYGDDLP